MSPFESTTRKLLTLTGGAGGHSDNIFLVTTPCEILGIWGVVTSALQKNLLNAGLDIIGGGGPTALSLPNVSISQFKVGSLIVKQYEASDSLTAQNANNAYLFELGAGSDPTFPFLVVPENGASTYIRFVHDSSGVTGGTILWSVRYRALGRGGISAA